MIQMIYEAFGVGCFRELFCLFVNADTVADFFATLLYPALFKRLSALRMFFLPKLLKMLTEMLWKSAELLQKLTI